jgi:hypothetical protein
MQGNVCKIISLQIHTKSHDSRKGNFSFIKNILISSKYLIRLWRTEPRLNKWTLHYINCHLYTEITSHIKYWNFLPLSKHTPAFARKASLFTIQWKPSNGCVTYFVSEVTKPASLPTTLFAPTVLTGNVFERTICLLVSSFTTDLFHPQWYFQGNLPS